MHVTYSPQNLIQFTTEPRERATLMWPHQNTYTHTVHIYTKMRRDTNKKAIKRWKKKNRKRKMEKMLKRSTADKHFERKILVILDVCLSLMSRLQTWPSPFLLDILFGSVGRLIFLVEIQFEKCFTSSWFRFVVSL